ncbi:MAG: hypothetical protein IKJ18_01445 [Bacteroidaceae bacterium]|nr:hypothetical protein [Bacteroidaceae bacterium]
MEPQDFGQVPEELRGLFKSLSEQGWNPQLCDEVPVPHYDNRVPCGVPAGVGDITHDEYDMMPRSLVTLNMMYTLDAYGDSMVGAGIDHGDRLEVLSTPVARHGDIVVASIGDGHTVKSYFVDDYGRRWLVPANRKYKPMLITEERCVRIEGRVVSVRKLDPRAENRDMRNAVVACEEYTVPDTRSKYDRTVHFVRRVAPMVKQGRQWYAVYRAMLDRRIIEEDSFTQFVQMVHEAVPEHAHLPVTAELRRMGVQSFRRAVDLWDETDAPVAGARFEAYLQIARATMEYIKESMTK